MARLIGLTFLLLPLLEIAVFIVVGHYVGLLPTMGLVIASTVLGAFVLQQQGLDVVNRLRGSVGSGTIPGHSMFDTMLIGLAGILLIVPGFITDIVALLLLLPPVRNLIFARLASRVRVDETTTTYRRHADINDPRLSGPGTVDLDEDDWRGDRQR